MMYFRPGSGLEWFQVEENLTKVDSSGRLLTEFKPLARPVLGLKSRATPYEREKFKHLSHEVDTVILQQSDALAAKVGDRLVKGKNAYYVAGVECVMGRDVWYIYYCWERKL